MTLKSKVTELAAKMLNKDDIRYGQALFNATYDIDPEFADEIRGSDIDPFYSGCEDRRIQSFLKLLEERK